MHQGRPRMNILRAMPKKAWRIFRLPMHFGKYLGEDVAVVAWVKCENPGALPPFPAWERVLATDIGDLGIMAGPNIMGDEVDDVTRSITEYERVALSDFAFGIADPKCNL